MIDKRFPRILYNLNASTNESPYYGMKNIAYSRNCSALAKSNLFPIGFMHRRAPSHLIFRWESIRTNWIVLCLIFIYSNAIVACFWSYFWLFSYHTSPDLGTSGFRSCNCITSDCIHSIIVSLNRWSISINWLKSCEMLLLSWFDSYLLLFLLLDLELTEELRI